jgi:MFS family permease
LAFGAFYCWGNLTTYVTSYLRKFDPEITSQQSLATFALCAVGTAAIITPAGLVEQKLGPRVTAMISALVMAGGVAISSFMTSLPAFVVTYGVMYGFGIGVGYTCPLVCGLKWMPHRKGLINGIVTGGFGLGAFMFNFVITGYVRCAFSDRTLFGVRKEGCWFLHL